MEYIAKNSRQTTKEYSLVNNEYTITFGMHQWSTILLLFAIVHHPIHFIDEFVKYSVIKRLSKTALL